MKMIGKPYSGKLNVRFDEGVLEIEYGWASEALSTERDRNRYAQPVATTPGLHSTVKVATFNQLPTDLLQDEVLVKT
jgi:hypothetical protein